MNKNQNSILLPSVTFLFPKQKGQSLYYIFGNILIPHPMFILKQEIPISVVNI